MILKLIAGLSVILIIVAIVKFIIFVNKLPDDGGFD